MTTADRKFVIEVALAITSTLILVLGDSKSVLYYSNACKDSLIEELEAANNAN